VIMGNGPSLNQLLEDSRENLGKYDLVAVNFMGLSSEFLITKPNVYVLCDPAFWFLPIDTDNEGTNKKVTNLYQRFADLVDWDMQLYLPYQAEKVKLIGQLLSKNPHIQLSYFNKTKVEGFEYFQYFAVRKQLGMFRVQNVVVAALLLAIFSEYKEIYLMGVESDWMRNFWVDEQNRLRISDTHFYGKQDKILPINMRQECASLYYAFDSYTKIAAYATKMKSKIYNLNLFSMIDVFEKKEKLDTPIHSDMFL